MFVECRFPRCCRVQNFSPLELTSCFPLSPLARLHLPKAARQLNNLTLSEIARLRPLSAMLKFPLPLLVGLSQLAVTRAQTCSFVYQGCWTDNITNRLVPNQVTPPSGSAPFRWTSLWACQQAAIALGYDTVAVQNGGVCFGGVNSSYNTLGRATSCAALGGANSSQIFQLMPRGCTQSCTWAYKGCFNDAASRRMPTQLAVTLPSSQHCMRLAVAGGFDTVGWTRGHG